MKSNPPPPPKHAPRTHMSPPDSLNFSTTQPLQIGSQTDMSNMAIGSFTGNSIFGQGRSAPVAQHLLPQVADPVITPARSYAEPPMLLLPASLTKNTDDWQNAPHGRSLTNDSYIGSLSSSAFDRDDMNRQEDSDFGMGKSPTALSIMTSRALPTNNDNSMDNTNRGQIPIQHSSRASILSTRPQFDSVLDEESDVEELEDANDDEEEVEDNLQFDFRI